MEGISRTKFVVTLLVATVIGLLLNPNMPFGSMIWPPAEIEAMGDPVAAQGMLLLAYGVVAAVGFGVGVAWLFLGWPVVRRAAGSLPLAVAGHVAVVWLLASWVPHDALHMALGFNLWGLIALEWGFHATLIVAGCILARFLYKVARGSATQPAAVRHGAAASVAGLETRGGSGG